MQYLKYKESKARGSFGFPIELYCVNPQHPQYIMPCHWHLEHEMIRVLRGSFAYTIDGQSGVASAGEMLYVNGGSLHFGVPQNCVYECIVFDLELLLRGDDACAAMLRDFENHTLTVNRNLSNEDDELRNIMNKLFSALSEKQDGHQLAVQGLLYQFFGHVLKCKYYTKSITAAGASQRRMRQLKQVLSMIESDYASSITLEQLAHAAGMTPKYFCRFFQDMTGRTPIDYLNYHRIEVACFQLVFDHRSITELSYACGFNDLSYFIRVFKKYKGVTPKRFLERARSG